MAPKMSGELVGGVACEFKMAGNKIKISRKLYLGGVTIQFTP